jgi:hypothetical protein
LRSNTPLSEAINCLEAFEPNNSSVKREVIVIELIPMTGQLPQTIQQVADRISSIRSGCPRVLRAKTARASGECDPAAH